MTRQQKPEEPKRTTEAGPSIRHHGKVAGTPPQFRVPMTQDPGVEVVVLNVAQPADTDPGAEEASRRS